MLITDRGQTIRMCVDEIRETSRNAQGVRLMTLADGERIVAAERLAESEAGDDGGSMAPPSNGGTLPPPSELN
jgi:DNA gyrase subunit A